jgi:sulfite exporter TauE/SafE
MPESALLAAFLAGLLGGVHCVAMCGGWLAVAAHRPATAVLMPAAVLRWSQVACHAGRLTTYAVLGVVVGAAGGAVYALALAPVQRAVYVTANLLLLVLACSLALRGFQWNLIERAGLALFRGLLPLVKRVAPRTGLPARYALGLAWGATPCALIYGVLPVAMFAGSAADGALVMLAFGAGTLPNLLAAGWLLGRAPRLFEADGVRYGAAALVGAFAVFGIYRALFVPEALGQGPFCLTG